MRVTKFCEVHGWTGFSLQKQHKIKRWCCLRCGADRIKKMRTSIKQRAVEYMGGQCILCGYDKCASALEFHHLKHSEKKFEFRNNGRSLSVAVMQKELDKCIMLCANCHRELHSGDYH